MANAGIDGETSEAGHSESIDIDAGGSSQGGRSAGGSSGSAGGGGSRGNPAWVIAGAAALAGLMLLAALLIALLAIISKMGDSTQEDMVLEPEEISLDEGSANLNARYTTEDIEFFHANGEDDISLSIVKNEDTSDLYDVKGTLNSVQKVGIDGMDQGDICTVEILHETQYTVQGTFSPTQCVFELSVTMAPDASQLLATGCIVDINFDVGALYMAPMPGTLVFTKPLERTGSEGFSFYLHEVALPRGVNCPAFSSP